MKKELIVTAKTVDEAKEKAAAELGVAVEALEFTVLEEGKRGFHDIRKIHYLIPPSVFLVVHFSMKGTRRFIARIEIETPSG